LQSEIFHARLQEVCKSNLRFFFFFFNLYAACGAEESCTGKELVENPVFLYLHGQFSSVVGMDISVGVWREVCFKNRKAWL